MNKKYLVLSLSLLALPAMAQQKLDAQSILALNQMHTSLQSARRAAPAGQSVASPEISVMVRMYSGYEPSEITCGGARIGVERGEFAVVTLPLDSLDRLAALPGVQSISYKQPKRDCLDMANAESGVDKVHAGTGLNQPYTGKGVVVGVLDDYLDPNHIMFRDPTTGENRVKIFVCSNGEVLSTPEQIAAYEPNNQDKSYDHGTHVTGIAAGYYDDGTFSCHGVAPEADILMGYSSDETADFMSRVEVFTRYSKKRGKPLVINMSYEPYSCGAHDGTHPIAAYIDRVVSDGDAVFCIAAGNEGDAVGSQEKTFGDGDEMKAVLKDVDYGNLSLWSDSNTKFTTKIVLIDNLTKEIVLTLSPDQTGISQFDTENYPDLAKVFTGKIYTIGNVDQNNFKYNLYIGFNVTTSSTYAARYSLGYIVTGSNGQTVTASSHGMPYFDTGGMEGWGEGITKGNVVNDYACGSESIVLGSYTTRDSGKYANGTSYSLKSRYNVDDLRGDVSSFTSYGTFSTGRSYPHLLAPGSLIVSAMSTYYMENTSIDHTPYTNSVTSDGRTYYWTAYPGTSMASPYMAGTAALWLEADPTLTARDIRDIATGTARRDIFVKNAKNQVQCGAGKLDVYAGLEKVLERVAAGLGHIESGKDFIWRAAPDGGYEFFSAGATSLSATVYNMRGEAVAHSRSAGDRLSLSVDSLPRGVYAVKVSDGKTTHAVKIVN